ASVLKERTSDWRRRALVGVRIDGRWRRSPHRSLGKIGKLVVCRHPSCFPMTQSIDGADPHAAVGRGKDGGDPAPGKTLPASKLRGRGLMKAIESTARPDPDISVAILKDAADGIARQTIGS